LVFNPTYRERKKLMTDLDINVLHDSANDVERLGNTIINEPIKMLDLCYGVYTLDEAMESLIAQINERERYVLTKSKFLARTYTQDKNRYFVISFGNEGLGHLLLLEFNITTATIMKASGCELLDKAINELDEWVSDRP